MKYALALAALLSSEVAWGDDYSLKLTEFSVEYYKFEGRRHSYFPDHKSTDWVAGSKVNYTLGVFKHLYWSNTLHFEMDNSVQIRSGGWLYELGAKPFKWLDIYRHHHSQHSFEAVNSNGQRFPVSDAYGVRLNLIN